MAGVVLRIGFESLAVHLAHNKSDTGLEPRE
jgi:hypothetical protein